MSLVLTEEHQLLKESAADFVRTRSSLKRIRALRDGGDRDGFSRDLWHEMAALGWTGIVIPEKYGGSGVKDFRYDEILIEEPTYELIASTAKFLGLEIRSFPRRFEDGYKIDPSEIRRRVTSRTRLIVFCNLHNPSGVMEDEATVVAIAEIARQHGIHMLVDEVYLDAAFEHKTRSAFHIAPDVAVDPKLALVTALEKAGLSHDEAVRLDALEVPAEPVHRDQLRAR